MAPTPKWLGAEAEFESWYSSKASFCYKFEDARMVMGVNRSKSVTAHGQPADYIVTDRGNTFWAEVKSCSNPTSFPFSNVRKPQWNGARQVTAAGGTYWFFIRREPEMIWYRVPGLYMVTSFFDLEEKSVKWEQLSRYQYGR